MTTTTSAQAPFTPVIEPHTQQWLDELAAASAGGPPLYELSPKDCLLYTSPSPRDRG